MSYYTDLIEITNITTDSVNRTETEGVPFEQKAYVEIESKIRYDSNGQPLDSTRNIFLPPLVNVSKGDYVKVLSIRGVTITGDLSIRKKIFYSSSFGANTDDHIEVKI